MGDVKVQLTTNDFFYGGGGFKVPLTSNAQIFGGGKRSMGVKVPLAINVCGVA